MISNQTVGLNENQLLLAARMVREFYYPNREKYSPDWILIVAIRELLMLRPDASPEDMHEFLITQSKIKSRGGLSRYAVSSFMADLAPEKTGPGDPAEISVFTGGRCFSFAKISAMASFFTCRVPEMCESRLNQLLFYSDFANYLIYGHSISGSRYVRLLQGPVVYQYDRILKAMAFMGIIKLWNRSGCKIEPVAGAAGAVDSLSMLELISVQWTFATFGLMTAPEIDEYSQKEFAYRFTRLDDFIAYEYAPLLRKLPEAGN